MSLVAWYPFNNNYVTLKDQSFSGNDLQYLNIANNISSSSNGLLGSCARRTLLNTSDLYRAVDKVDLGDEFTFACWVYPTECHVGTANGVVTNHSHVGNTGSGITLKYISATDFRLSCNTGTGTSRTYHTYYGTTNIYNKWSHVAVRYKDGEFTLWVNGVIELTFAYAQYNVEDYLDIFNWSTTNSSSGSYRPVCRINDVRVYDHAISTREMKELARGRFLHYTFEDHFYGSKQNINRTWSIYAPYATLISRSDSHWEVSELRAGNTVIAVNNGETFAVGQRVRISGYMTINGTPVAVTNATTYATTESIENDPETGWFSTVEVFDSAATWLFHAPYGSLNIGDIVRCDGIVIEKLSADTGTYSVVKDHSGYGNDSVTLTNLVPGRSEVDTGKGLAAGKFTSDSQVQIPQINRDGSTLTLTGWVNLSSYSSSYSPLFDYPFYLHVNYAGKVTSFWYNTTPAGYHTGVTTVPLNTWTMISATWDGVN
ncbi:MAG: LamG domain-containing protein, partial [Gammaproteobacteria bacterium]|nr:LamG domain-containing protein [Gammaproteobacteria bacterium]